jgi:hypothetical protein
VSGKGAAAVSKAGTLTGLHRGAVQVSATVVDLPGLKASTEVLVTGLASGAAGAGVDLGTPRAKASAGKRKVTLRWPKVSGAGGYLVAYRAKGATGWNVKAVRSGSRALAVKGLKSGKRYQLRVRAYVKVGGQALFSPWSRVVGAKPK